MPKTRYTGRHRPAAKPSRGRQFVVPVALLSTTVAGGLVARDAGASELPQAAAMKNVANSAALGLTEDSGAVAAAANRAGARSSRDMARDAKTLVVGAGQSAAQTAAQAKRRGRRPGCRRQGEARGGRPRDRPGPSLGLPRRRLHAHLRLRPALGQAAPGPGPRLPRRQPGPRALERHRGLRRLVHRGLRQPGQDPLLGRHRLLDGAQQPPARRRRRRRSRPGSAIAYSGSTGHSTGPHVHLEIHPGDGSARRPQPRGSPRGAL